MCLKGGVILWGNQGYVTVFVVLSLNLLKLTFFNAKVILLSLELQILIAGLITAQYQSYRN